MYDQVLQAIQTVGTPGGEKKIVVVQQGAVSQQIPSGQIVVSEGSVAKSDHVGQEGVVDSSSVQGEWVIGNVRICERGWSDIFVLILTQK